MSVPLLPSVRSPAFIDPRSTRVAAALTTVVLAAALLTGEALLLLAQAVVFALGVAGRSPYGTAFRRLVRPHLGPPAELEDPRPPRFAQLVGLVFVIAALAGHVGGSSVLAVAATAAALFAAFLNAASGVCLGCEAYLLLARARGRARPARTSTSNPTRTEVPA